MPAGAPGSTPVDRFFAVPMVLLALTFPVFFFGGGSGHTPGWLLYGAGLLLTISGYIYCALTRKDASVGGVSCAVGAVIIGLLAWTSFGGPW
ncbi:hypothetical protein ACFWUW_07770 [Streptomyces sp. NPDC058655]|uniref:hypothetical protein n=1 Tax=Streptomyces sp. NPDC058655 TaxID=3346577 RepID=UPI0036629DE9